MIGIPCFDMVHAEFAFSLAALVCHTQVTSAVEWLQLARVSGPNLCELRSNLAKKALEADATHLFFLDSDMKFPATALIQLMSHDLPIVGANYAKRKLPIEPVTKGWDADRKQRIPIFTLDDSTGVEHVVFTGTGCMLIKTDVFKNMPKPWFEAPYIESADHFPTEDVPFCLKANRMGMKVYIDHDLSKEIGHIGQWQYNILQAHPEIADIPNDDPHDDPYEAPV